jgi:hypothetical protein
MLPLKVCLGSFFVVLIACRYSTFMVLYPTGITSEVGLIYIALPYMKVNLKNYRDVPQIRLATILPDCSVSWATTVRHRRNIALGCPTHGISPLITCTHLSLPSPSMFQVPYSLPVAFSFRDRHYEWAWFDKTAHCFTLSDAGSPHMYNYMRAQRKKALAKAKTA